MAERGVDTKVGIWRNAKRSLQSLVWDVLVGIFTAPILGYGLTMTVSTPWGTSPWDVFHLGVVHHTSLSLGQVGQLTGLVLIFVSLALSRRYVRPLTIVNALAVGWCIDFYRAHEWTAQVSGFWGLLYLECGVFIFAVGMALYMAFDRGGGPRDALMLSVSERLHLPVGPVRIVLDLMVVSVGFLLQGPVGIGTILAALTLGPWVQWLMPPFRLGVNFVRSRVFANMSRASSA